MFSFLPSKIPGFENCPFFLPESPTFPLPCRRYLGTFFSPDRPSESLFFRPSQLSFSAGNPTFLVRAVLIFLTVAGPPPLARSPIYVDRFPLCLSFPTSVLVSFFFFLCPCPRRIFFQRLFLTSDAAVHICPFLPVPCTRHEAFSSRVPPLVRCFLASPQAFFFFLVSLGESGPSFFSRNDGQAFFVMPFFQCDPLRLGFLCGRDKVEWE